MRAEAHHARIGPFYFPPFALAASVEARVEHAASVGGDIQQRKEDSPLSRIDLPGNVSKARLGEAERARRYRPLTAHENIYGLCNAGPVLRRVPQGSSFEESDHA